VILYAMIIKFTLTGGFITYSNTQFHQEESVCWATGLAIYEKYRKVDGVDAVEVKCLEVIPFKEVEKDKDI